MGTVSYSESPNLSGIYWIKQFSPVSVRISKVTVTVTTSQPGTVMLYYGNQPDQYGRLEWSLGSIQTLAADTPTSKVSSNPGTGKGIYFSAGAHPSGNVLKRIVVTIDYEEPAALAGTLRVQTVDTAMSVISGATVSCDPVAAGETASKTTDALGWVSFTIPINTAIAYNATKSGYASASSVFAGITEAGVTKSAVLMLQAYVVPPPPPPPTPPTVTPGNLAVTVKSADGAMLEAATVTVNGYSLFQSAMIGVTFTGLTPKTYTVTASRSGYVSGSTTATVVSGQTTSITMYLQPELVTPPTASFSVRVKDSAGNPVPSVAVRLDTTTRTTEDNGVTGLFSLPTGTYTIYISKPPLEPYTGSATITTSTQIVDVVMEPSAAIPSALVDFCKTKGIPISDIPMNSTDVILITFASALDLKGHDVTEVLPLLSSELATKYPKAHIWGVGLYSNNTKLAIWTSGSENYDVAQTLSLGGYEDVGAKRVSLIAPLVVYAVVVIIGIIFASLAIIIPAITSWATVERQAEIIKGNQERIDAILADPTLTADQKAALIEDIIKAGGITPPAPPPSGLGGIVNLIIIAAVAGVGGYAAYKIIQHAAEKKK